LDLALCGDGEGEADGERCVDLEDREAARGAGGAVGGGDEAGSVEMDDEATFADKGRARASCPDRGDARRGANEVTWARASSSSDAASTASSAARQSDLYATGAGASVSVSDSEDDDATGVACEVAESEDAIIGAGTCGIEESGARVLSLSGAAGFARPYVRRTTGLGAIAGSASMSDSVVSAVIVVVVVV
jgi:hypothetical protein